MYICEGSAETAIDGQSAGKLIDILLAKIRKRYGNLRRVLLVPPDITRLHSFAGELTVMLYERLSSGVHVEVMPALGSHLPMTEAEIRKMFPGIPLSCFRIHDWRRDVTECGEVPAARIREISEGVLDFSITCSVNRILFEGRWDRIISIGRIVPHELAGIANFSKNILIGLGGSNTISKSHYTAAVYGMERLMGKIENPMRQILRYMEDNCISSLPLTYLMTVRSIHDGRLVTRGIFAGDDESAYRAGAEVCQKVSITKLDHPAGKIVAFMDGEDYHTAWVANKAIYRSRMALADGGELIVIAPGVKQFGEDEECDRFIRRVGYRTTKEMVNLVNNDPETAAHLTEVSHIIISSPEERFSMQYAPGQLSREETEAVGWHYCDPKDMMQRYDISRLNEGWNLLPDGEEVYFVPRPAGGLWCAEHRSEGNSSKFVGGMQYR
jgi:nickel-dependent lactate racemase